MKSQKKIIKILHDELLSSQAKNPAYSLRSFARRLNCSPSVLSEILNGNRPISRRNGEKFLNALNLSPDIVSKMISPIPNRSNRSEGSLKSFIELEIKEFNMVSNWYYFGILSLAETKKFESDPHWIAESLGISVSDAKKAINTLISLKLLRLTKDKKLKVTKKQFSTSTDVSSASIRKSHLQHLELAKKSLEEDDVAVRDFASMTLAIDPEKLDVAKKMLKDFRRKFCSQMEKTKKIQVYRLGTQLIPLSKRISK